MFLVFFRCIFLNTKRTREKTAGIFFLGSQILIFFQHMVQKIVKYIKLHVLGDVGDIWIGISEDIRKIDFSSNGTEILIP
jgi:hypothetical protein